jgi:hypothetical protein
MSAYYYSLYFPWQCRPQGSLWLPADCASPNTPTGEPSQVKDATYYGAASGGHSILHAKHSERGLLWSYLGHVQCTDSRDLQKEGGSCFKIVFYVQRLQRFL